MDSLIRWTRCWLDFNQTTPRFPLNPPHNGSGGPFSGTLRSIQQLVRNTHCCLVAEIHYPLDPIPGGATPGSHDNLSQRNLVVVESDNPGSPATHTVQSTFEIKPSAIQLTIPQAFGVITPAPPAPAAPVPAAPAAVAAAHVDHQPGLVIRPAALAARPAAVAPAAVVAQPPAAALAAAAVAVRPRLEADELMIRWDNLPRDSHVRLYAPDIDVGQIAAAAASRGGPHVLTAEEEGTLVCRVGDVTYIPVPGPRALNIPALLSIELPPTVTKGQRFSVTVHQISGLPRKIIGSFQVTIPVRTAVEILPRETRKLSVLRYIGESIPPGNRWYKIWGRFLKQVEDRVSGMGGDPGKVLPSPTGEGPATHEPESGEVGTEVTSGRVTRILYDCFGQFEGFTLETCDGRRAFRTCHRRIAAVVLKACHHDLPVTVWSTHSRIMRIAIDCC